MTTKKKKYNEYIMKRERKDSVWVYNIFSTRSSFSIINTMNSSYQLGFDEIRNSIFHAVSLKNIKESGIFQHNQ
jgi:hypothetical protein